MHTQLTAIATQPLQRLPPVPRRSTPSCSGAAPSPCQWRFLLEGSYADPGVRSFALTSLARAPAGHLLALAPSLALSAVSWEASLDGPLTRFLLAACVDAPSTMGRQLLWAWRASLPLSGGHGRAVHLLRCLLDALPDLATPENALQAYGLSQLAAACRRAMMPPHGRAASSTSAASGGAVSRTAVLRAGLAGLLLPHTLRLPLAAQAPVLPSLLYKAQADGSLARALVALARAADGEDSATAAAAQALAAAMGIQLHFSSSSSPVRAHAARDADSDEETDSDDDDDEDEDEDDDSTPQGEALLTAIDDAVALSLVALGAYADGAAMGLPVDLAASAPILASRMETAVLQAAKRADVRLPGALCAITATGAGTAVQLAAAGPLEQLEDPAAATPVPYPAQALRFLRRAAHALPPSYGTDSRSSALLRQQQPAQASLPLLPFPGGTALPASGVCVGAPVIGACRVVYASLRRRYSRSLLVFRAAKDFDEAGPPSSSSSKASGGTGTGVASQSGALSVFYGDPYPEIVKFKLGVPRPLQH